MSEVFLIELQRSVQNLLLGERCASAEFIVETAQVPRATRCGIYINAYHARFAQALAADYSALETYLGADEFARLVKAYIEAHPSRYFSMRFVGEFLSDFMRDNAPYNEHRDLAELAKFEWALCHAFDAADSHVLSIDDLRSMDPAAWPALQLKFHPSSKELQLIGNTPAQWTALNAQQSPPEFKEASGGQSWIVWRSELRLLFRALSEYEPIALAAFQSGQNFSQVCEALIETLPAEQIPPLLAGFIQQWLRDGLIVGANV